MDNKDAASQTTNRQQQEKEMNTFLIIFQLQEIMKIYGEEQQKLQRDINLLKIAIAIITGVFTLIVFSGTLW
ncbi:MAG: hypothetical protein ACOCRO_07810 [Halanaerobiales bacterium]